MLLTRQLWPFLLRDPRGGWAAAYHARHTLPLIEAWSWELWGEKPHTVPVHVLTSGRDWRLAAWMLASWFHFTQCAWPLVVHDDGTLPPEARPALARLFGEVRIISRGEADRTMNAALKDFPLCQQYRHDVPRALKLFDSAHCAQSEKFYLFDSDLLFFAVPREAREWADNPAPECWFMEDVQETLLLPPRHCQDAFGVTPWSRLNSGMALLCKSAIDLELCERGLKEKAILHGDARRVEQTLLALCAAKHGHGGLLPKRYEVSLNRQAAPDAIARHYFGPSRDYIFSEGIRRADTALFEEDAE